MESYLCAAAAGLVVVLVFAALVRLALTTAAYDETIERPRD